MKFPVLAGLLFFVLALAAQQPVVEISNAGRLPAKTNKFRIVGKNNDGIMVRLYGGDDIIDVYDEQLKLSTAKTIDYKNQGGVSQYIMLNKTGAVIFYLSPDKKYAALLAQPVNGKLVEMGKPIIIDTIFDRKDMVATNLRFKPSTDQSYLLVYHTFFTGTKATAIKVICLDHTLKQLYNKTIPLSRDEKELEDLKSFVDNNGNAYFIMHSAQQAGEADSYDVLRVSETGDFANYTIGTNKVIFGEASFDIDNKNGNLAMCAFYNDNKVANEEAANGFLYASFDPANGIPVKTNYTVFPTEFITELTGRQTKESGKLFTFNIRKMVLRNDGGALIVAESFIKDTREIPMAMGIQPGYSNYRTSTVYQFNDIIAFSMNANGTMEWNSVMRKKQASEDDNGAYSSFLIVNEKDRLHLLFLDDINNSGTLNEYVLTSEGKSTRNAILNQEEKDVLLLPKMGRQLSPNQVVIPSYKNNSLRLVKITF